MLPCKVQCFRDTQVDLKWAVFSVLQVTDCGQEPAVHIFDQPAGSAALK